MENDEVGNVIKLLKEFGERQGIEIFDVYEFSADNIPTVFISSSGSETIVETDEEANTEVDRIMRMAKQLGTKVILYEVGFNKYNDKEGHLMNLHIIHNNVNYVCNITFLSYLDVEAEEHNEMDRKLKEVKEIIESVFKTDDFNPDSLVRNSLIPYLSKNNVDYMNEFTNINEVLNGWFAEITGMENFPNIIDELKIFYVDDDLNAEDTNLIRSNFSMIDKLLTLIPEMYEKTQYSEIGFLIKTFKDLELAIHLRAKEAAMNKINKEYVQKVTESFLSYRKSMGIRNPKVTKEEIESYLRNVSVDINVPREALKIAMYDMANEKTYD